MNYYGEKQYIAHIDENDMILGAVEKWEAHRKRILHRAFTAILVFDNKYVLQHRKHPVFDGCLDLSFSSHQLYRDSVLEDDDVAIANTLEREWNIKMESIKSTPKKIGSIYYEEKDPYSEYSDHEIDYIYRIELDFMPTPNYEFAYGFSLVEKKDLGKHFSAIYAPWVKKILEKNII